LLRPARIQSDRQQSAGDDEALTLDWKQTERSEDEGELPNLRHCITWRASFTPQKIGPA
jgi:hypothetical protein